MGRTANRAWPVAILFGGLGLAVVLGLLTGDGWLAGGMVAATLLAAGVLRAGFPPRTGRIRMDLWLGWVLAGSAALLLAGWADPDDNRLALAVLVLSILAAYLALFRVITRVGLAGEADLDPGRRWRSWVACLGLTGAAALLWVDWADPYGDDLGPFAVFALLILAAYLALPRVITPVRAVGETHLDPGPRWHPWLPWLGLLVIAWLAGYGPMAENAPYLSMFLGFIAPAIWLLGSYAGPAKSRDTQSDATWRRIAFRRALTVLAGLVYLFLAYTGSSLSDWAITDRCESWLSGEPSSFCDFAIGKENAGSREVAHEDLFWTPFWVCGAGLLLALITRRAIVMHMVCGLSALAAWLTWFWAIG